MTANGVTREVARRAAATGKERRADRVRVGWWVYSHGPYDLGSWGRVTATTSTVDPATGRTVVRLRVTDPRTGRPVEVEAAPGYPAWCCTPAEARRAGLT